jgi:hypothetical protein
MEGWRGRVGTAPRQRSTLRPAGIAFGSLTVAARPLDDPFGQGGLVSIVTRALLTDLACSVARLESFELAGLRGWPAIVLYAKVSTLS